MRYYSSTAGEMTLQTAIAAGDTTILVSTTAGLPVTFPYTLILDYGTGAEEVIDVSAASGTTLTVVRGRDGTVAQSHAFGSKIRHGMTGRDLRESREHEAATSAHGITGSVVGTSDTQTLDNKTFQPAADNTAATFRERSGNTAPLADIRASSDVRSATFGAGGWSSYFSGSVIGQFLAGGAVNIAKAILSLQVKSDIHAIVGSVVAGATSKFIRLMNGATELFSVDAAGKMTATDINVAGTGWVDVTLNAGFTAISPVQVRRIGSVVYWRGEITRTAGNYPTTASTIGTLPDPKFRPVAFLRAPLAGFGSASGNGLMVNLSSSTSSVDILGMGVSTDIARMGSLSYLAD